MRSGPLTCALTPFFLGHASSGPSTTKRGYTATGHYLLRCGPREPGTRTEVRPAFSQRHGYEEFRHLVAKSINFLLLRPMFRQFSVWAVIQVSPGSSPYIHLLAL